MGADAIQLNLFGDIVNLDQLTSKKDVHNEINTLGTDGARSLENLPTNEVQNPSGTRDTSRGIGESSGSNEISVSGNDGRWGEEKRSSGNTAPRVHSLDTRGERGGDSVDHTDLRGNYHITASDQIGTGGKGAKFNANLEAITLLKRIESEGRKATTSEQSILVKYTGWGGLSEAFKESHDSPWHGRNKALKELLTPEEFSKASRSTLNAHYTDPAIINAIWSAVLKMGYNGGPTLEPAVGVGHFFGTRPLNIPIEMQGIEIDQISGQIAQQLYQSADIRISGYEDIRMPNNQYNLIISNVPFGDYKPYEEKRNQTPGLDNRYAIHDFYFLKSLYGLKEGGMIAFITSRYTLDKKDTTVREKIAAEADFIGAIRLPNNAFSQIAHTEVVTDIVFLQKRAPDTSMSDLTKQFITTGTITIEAPDHTTHDHTINKYYIDHPGMIIGSHDVSGTMYSKYDYSVSLTTADISTELTRVISLLPANVMSLAIEKRTHSLDTSLDDAISHIKIDSIPAGSFILGLDDKLYQKIYYKDLLTSKIELSPLYDNAAQNADSINCIKHMMQIRECVRNAINHYNGDQQFKVKDDLANLNSLYDSFVKMYGFLNLKKNIYLFNDDPDSSLLQSLEKWNAKTKTATKADIFSGISFVRKETPTHVNSPIDAMVLSLSRYGHINIGYMESLTGKDQTDLITSLLSSGHLYQDPYDYLHHNRSTYLTADQYLSGNIRTKLQVAQHAAQKDPTIFSRNVNELQRVLPIDLLPEEISLRMNSPVIGKTHVKDFVCELLEFNQDHVHVLHIPITGKWDIQSDFRYATTNTETYGTPSLTAIDIINLQMNGKPIKIYHKTEEGEPLRINIEETAAAELKAEAIENAFHQWIWKDPARTDDICKRYNEVYNSHVERVYVHPDRMVNPNAEIWLHGCNFPFGYN